MLGSRKERQRYGNLLDLKPAISINYNHFFATFAPSNPRGMESIDRTKELETKSIGRLLWMYALPSIVSQIIASVYNIVDRVFLGQCVGSLAIAGLAITMPIMNIIHAFGSLVGVGSSARMSIVLGKKITTGPKIFWVTACC